LDVTAAAAMCPVSGERSGVCFADLGCVWFGLVREEYAVGAVAGILWG
jgi:hypothetical protein